ncbi:MAG: hypothetical protein OQL20_07820 [Sedimenticola sp.]|nr:hypothetical protein [Sedimenticola sp.]
MRYLFYLLPLAFAADTLFGRLNRPTGYIDLWEIDTVVFLLLTVPALLQLIYEAMPYRKSRDGWMWMPKLHIKTNPIPLDISSRIDGTGYRADQVTEQGTRLRRGNHWSGELMWLENSPSGEGEIRHRYLNFRLLGNGKPDAAMEQVLAQLEDAQPRPADLAKLMQERFGMILPNALLPNLPLQPMDETGLLVGNIPSGQSPCLIPEQLEDYLIHPSDNYFYYGFWGYGENSHAFYYVNMTEQQTIWLRLPYGGAYNDLTRDAEHIAALLQSLARLLPRYPHLRLIQNMGEGELALGPDSPEISWRYPAIIDLDQLLNDTPHPVA